MSKNATESDGKAAESTETVQDASDGNVTEEPTGDTEASQSSSDDDNTELTTRNGIIWEWLPTLIAGTSLLSFVTLIVLTTTPLPISVRSVPPEWFALYVTLVGSSMVTTLGAKAIRSWKQITG